MQHHGYGQGEYQYFAYPLPAAVAKLREAFYARLAPVANRWSRALEEERHFPPNLEDFLGECHGAGQTRPTPLMLKYGPGDYNRLHQDLYGAHVFPLQLTILLSEPEADFSGGEFVLTEQRPRQQSRAEVVPLRQGEAVIFAVHHRPARVLAEFTAPIYATASARCAAANASPWGSSFTMRREACGNDEGSRSPQNAYLKVSMSFSNCWAMSLRVRSVNMSRYLSARDRDSCSQPDIAG